MALRLRCVFGDSNLKPSLVCSSDSTTMIVLVGGYQWQFVCPVVNRFCSVLWRPADATRFCSRQAWGKQVAYASQFLDRNARAHRGKARINSRLCRIGGFSPDDWDFPPKPKWMRWRTYERYEERYDSYEEILDYGFVERAAKLVKRFY